jgi:segregation and condensation protein A
MTEPMKVKLPVYEGPLDLLLDLIEKNEMDITNIQISLVCQQYLDYLNQMRELNLEIAGDFLVMAATLLYIKSKMLLPPTEEEEKEEGPDPRTVLIEKLLEYQAFKKAAQELGILETERGKLFTRQIADYYLQEIEFDEPEIDTFSANLYDLLQAFHQVLAKSSKDLVHEIYEEEISIEQKIEEIKHRLAAENRFAFSSLFAKPWTKNQLIATFLALLEIVRMKLVRIFQDQTFGEIMIERKETRG